MQLDPLSDDARRQSSSSSALLPIVRRPSNTTREFEAPSGNADEASGLSASVTGNGRVSERDHADTAEKTPLELAAPPVATGGPPLGVSDRLYESAWKWGVVGPSPLWIRTIKSCILIAKVRRFLEEIGFFF